MPHVRCRWLKTERFSAPRGASKSAWATSNAVRDSAILVGTSRRAQTTLFDSVRLSTCDASIRAKQRSSTASSLASSLSIRYSAFARDKGFGVLVERRGFFASELEHLFWRSWHPTSVLLKYDDRSRHGMAWNKCWKSPVRHNRTADLCFNVEQGAVLVMANRKGAKRQVVPPADPTAGALRQAVPPAVPTAMSLMVQSDLVKLGLYQPSRRASDIPIVVVIQRQGGSRTFLNFSSILPQLSRDIQPATVITYSGDESLKETIRLYASASVVVGYHGAAFANVLFSKPRTLAIEIFTRPCGSKYLGFNYRMANRSGLQWRTLFVGTPYANAQTPTPLHDRGMSMCKPAFVSLTAEDIHTVGRCIREELSTSL